MSEREEKKEDPAGLNDSTFLGEDGLLHCRICGEPREAYLPIGPSLLMRKKKHFRPCLCLEKQYAEAEKLRLKQQHEEKVAHLRRECYQGQCIPKATFDTSESDSDAMMFCREYARTWDEQRRKNIGLLLWGDVGTGKTNAAICIANALMEKEVPVRMLNFGQIMNADFDEKSRIMETIPDPALLILDDFGMERSSDYGLEIVFQVIDSRYRSEKPLIVTTNLSMDTLKHAEDLSHRRIYDRILERCVPVQFKGLDYREKIRKEKRKQFLEIIGM